MDEYDRDEQNWYKAVAIVKEKGEARISQIQRGLRLSFMQASALREAMRDMKVIDANNVYTPDAHEAYMAELVERGMVVVRRLLAEHAPANKSYQLQDWEDEIPQGVRYEGDE